MITLKIMSPLPDILKVTRDSRTVTRELAFSPGLTLYGAMELLAQEAPAFARRLADEGEEAYGIERLQLSQLVGVRGVH